LAVGQSYPGISTSNSRNGSIIANTAIVATGLNEQIRVAVGNPTNLIIEINGNFARGPWACMFMP
jgi:hypothetical protein